MSYNKQIILFIILGFVCKISCYSFQYVLENNCNQYNFVESTIVTSNCNISFPYGTNITYNIPAQGTGGRAAAVVNSGPCGAKWSLFEGGVSDFHDILYVDISNIDGFSAGLNVSAFYSDGTVNNIHCCSGCPNTTDSPNCWGPGNYWFPTEISGYGTIGWSTTNLTLLYVQFYCLSQQDLHACDNVVCLNGGVCMGGMGGICLCQPGWGGNNCSDKLDQTPCFGVDCGYYGVCNATTAEAGGNKCDCLSGYTGTLCTNPPTTSPCYGVNCGLHGICKQGNCECSAGFTGCDCSIAPNCTIIQNLEYQGNDISSVTVPTAIDCCNACKNTLGCRAFTFVGNSCYLKSSTGGNGTTIGANGKVSGYLPTTVIIEPSCNSNVTVKTITTGSTSGTSSTTILSSNETIRLLIAIIQLLILIYLIH